MENTCKCQGKKPIKLYCNHCKEYICSECHVTKHLDHEGDIVDLAEKCTRYLADYQRLSKKASFMVDRKQMYIKDESIEEIAHGIESEIVKSKKELLKDIADSIENSAKNMIYTPLIQDIVHTKDLLAVKTYEELIKIKNELDEISKQLLIDIAQDKLVTANQQINPAKLEEYDTALKGFINTAQFDNEFIQEIRKLKNTKVSYGFDPMAILGLIQVKSEVQKPPRTLSFDREKNMIGIFNLITKQLDYTEIASGYILPYRFMCIEAFNNLYLNGGDNNNGIFLKSHYIFEEFRGVFIQLANMNEARSSHALVADNKSIWAIGGEGAKGVLSKCEYCDSEGNEWVSGPELNEARCGHSACAIGRTIYVIGGWNKSSLSSIEMLNTAASHPKWETLSFSKKKGLKPVQIPGVCPIGPHEILIFGGHAEGDDLVNDCYVFDTKALTVVPKSRLAQKDSFISSEITVYENHIYAFGFATSSLHECDIKAMTWKILPKSTFTD